MNEPAIIFSDVNERQGGFLRRSFVFGGATVLGIAALGGRLAHLQLIEQGRYSTLSAQNQFNFRLIPPPRGRILDRNGVVLAGNRPSFRVLVVRDETKDLDATLDQVQRLIPAVADRRRTVLREVSQSPRFVPVAVASDLTWEEFARVNLHVSEMPGVMADMNEARFYPHGGAFAHVIGYVARVTDRDMARAREGGKRPDPILMHPGFRIGKQGVERAFDEELRGKPGAQKVEVDARGRVVGEDSDGSRAPEPGKDVVLTLDADVQNRALEVFGEESGAAVVMDVRNGDLLCLLSAPSFDPNLFVGGVPGRVYRALAEYERRPLLDKALSGTYPPGSTFKMLTALAALQHGISPSWRINCTGSYRLGNGVWRCWKHGGHGSVDMHIAIKTSCDTYFYEVARQMGPDKIAEVSRAFGLGQIFDIGIGNQRAGLVPDRAWKAKAKPSGETVWNPGNSVNYGIGQGYMHVNILQLAVMTARLANGRKAVEPRLIKSVGGVEQPSGADAPDLPVTPEKMKIIWEAMSAVANDTSGTAFRNSQLGLGPIKMAGKTGTAQSRSYRGGTRDNKLVTWALRDHALYVAYAPFDDPRYAIAVLVQHGGGGSAVAAPRARDIMKTVLLKDPEIRARIIAQPTADQPLPSGPVDDAEPDMFLDQLPGQPA